MFDLGATELLLIVVVAILVIGPKDMPVALRTAGRWIGKMRRLSSHFRTGLDTMIREAEMEEMEQKWQTQNAKIMAQHPAGSPVETERTGALPPRAPATSDTGLAADDSAPPDPAYAEGPYPMTEGAAAEARAGGAQAGGSDATEKPDPASIAPPSPAAKEP